MGNHRIINKYRWMFLGRFILLLICVVCVLSGCSIFNKQLDKDAQELSNPRAYPQLGMWWLNPYNTTVEEMARYDLLINEFDDPNLLDKRNAIKKVNPNAKLFRPISPSERSIFWEWEGKSYENPEIAHLPSSFFMLETGAELVKSIDSTETKIYVNSMTFKNGVSKFEVGGTVAIGQNESAYITAIDEALKCLTVKRGFGRTATSHLVGEIVATHVQFWVGTWVMNVSDTCPKVSIVGVAHPVNWIEYFYEMVTNPQLPIYQSTADNGNFVNQTDVGYDGIVIDRFEDKESWLIWQERGEVEIDLDQDLEGDTLESVDTRWQKGVDELYVLLHQHFPDLSIIRNNPLTIRSDIFDGQIYESGGWSEPSTEDWKSLFVDFDAKWGYDRLSYLEWFPIKKAIVMLEVYEDESMPEVSGDGQYDSPFLHSDFKPNYQRMRFSLTSALLGDGYYSYEMNTNGHGSLGLLWFDEYDNAGSGQGYLGQPTQNYVALENGGYTRTFQNGIVLVNPENHPISIHLEESYQKIKGKQVPEVNTGEVVQEVTLPAFDGLILVRKQ